MYRLFLVLVRRLLAAGKLGTGKIATLLKILLISELASAGVLALIEGWLARVRPGYFPKMEYSLDVVETAWDERATLIPFLADAVDGILEGRFTWPGARPGFAPGVTPTVASPLTAADRQACLDDATVMVEQFIKARPRPGDAASPY